jgi:hypothetical protein
MINDNCILTPIGVTGDAGLAQLPDGRFYADVFAFDAVQGNTYTINFVATNVNYTFLEETGLVFDSTDNNVGYCDQYNGGSFVAPATARFYVVGGASGEHSANVYNVSMVVTQARSDVEQLLADALASIKTYVDLKDAGVQTFAQGLIDQLMQTTDLQAKLTLLTEINTILDGDTATAGFQLWESSVSKLNQINVDLNAIKASASNPFASMKSKAATIFAV